MPTPNTVLRSGVAIPEAEFHERDTHESMAGTVLASIPGVVLRVSLDGVIEYVNRVLPEYAGAPLVGQSIYAFAPPDQHPALRAGLEKAMHTRRPSAFGMVSLAPDGTRCWYHTTVGPILDGAVLTGLTLVCVNSSAVKRAQSEASTSRAWLEVALKAGNVGAWSIDLDADVVTWNDELAGMFGLAPHEAPRTLAEFRGRVPPDQRPPFDQGLQAILSGAQVPPMELQLDGPRGPHTFIVQGGAQRNEAGRVTRIHGGMVDITQRRALEAQVRLSQKMDAVGQLSAGVAHNFNNMLAVIVPSLQLAAGKLAGADRAFMEDALQSAMRAASLVRQMMVFSRTGAPRECAREALDEVVRRAVDLCREAFDSRVSVTLDLAADAADASVDGAQVEQSVVNLLLNARDALLEARRPSGRIEVTVRRVSAGDLAHRLAAAGGDYVEVAVKDNGPGVDAAVLGRVFEPFFTTKVVGGGTGLGLATVWATAQAHGGFAECVSPPAAGATFRLYLRCEPLPGAQPAAERPLLKGEGRRVLLLEDEAAVARATSRVLTDAGYEVLLATSGVEAVRLAKDGPLAAALLDYSTPGQSAEETLAQLRVLQPTMRVLCFSGLGAPLPGADGQLSKPASPRALLESLETLLAR